MCFNYLDFGQEVPALNLPALKHRGVSATTITKYAKTRKYLEYSPESWTLATRNHRKLLS